MRASDEDRQRTVEELRRHCAAGRIDVDEYASRIERTLSAATLEELDEIRADLPMVRIAEPAGGPIWAGRRRTGMLEVANGGGTNGAGGTGADRRLLAIGVAVITVVVVMTAIVVGLVAEWAWAVLLLAGWAAGLVQGRLSRNGKRRT